MTKSCFARRIRLHDSTKKNERRMLSVFFVAGYVVSRLSITTHMETLQKATLGHFHRVLA